MAVGEKFVLVLEYNKRNGVYNLLKSMPDAAAYKYKTGIAVKNARINPVEDSLKKKTRFTADSKLLEKHGM